MCTPIAKGFAGLRPLWFCLFETFARDYRITPQMRLGAFIGWLQMTLTLKRTCTIETFPKPLRYAKIRSRNSKMR